jgi:uncharacterized protein (UPF0212 family)
MLTAAAPAVRAAQPPPDSCCPRCEGRVERIVRIARAAAVTIVITKDDADAIAAEADRLARAELAAAGGCWG